MNKNKYPHLVFYDGECGFCDGVVQCLTTKDKKKLFAFAPLQGKTAEKMLTKLPSKVKNVDSIILIENYRSSSPQIHILAKAALRIAWLLGGFWTLLGWLYFLPAWSTNWGYQLVSKNRKHLFGVIQCPVPSKDEQDRFLP